MQFGFLEMCRISRLVRSQKKPEKITRPYKKLSCFLGLGSSQGEGILVLIAALERFKKTTNYELRHSTIAKPSDEKGGVIPTF
jgi:hypothetical protein